MLFTCKTIFAEDLEVGDEIDADGDEYCDNEFAIFNYAKVLMRTDIYRHGEPWLLLRTNQGAFEVPGSHEIKVKVQE